jgi:hypothetical protein
MILAFVVLFSTSVFAQQVDYPMDEHYKAGDNLIYDCARKHYACVSNDGLEKCQNAREESIEKKQKEFACAPLKKFDEKTKCVVKNYQVVDQNAWKRFCYPK